MDVLDASGRDVATHMDARRPRSQGQSPTLVPKLSHSCGNVTACIAEIINTGGNSVFEVRAMGRNKKSRDEAAPEFTSGNWTEDDSRELQLMLMADELATIAYRTVD